MYDNVFTSINDLKRIVEGLVRLDVVIVGAERNNQLILVISETTMKISIVTDRDIIGNFGLRVMSPLRQAIEDWSIDVSSSGQKAF